MPAMRCDAMPCRLTALHFASLNEHTETAMALVAKGADVHLKADNGYSEYSHRRGTLSTLGVLTGPRPMECQRPAKTIRWRGTGAHRASAFTATGGRHCTSRR